MLAVNRLVKVPTLLVGIAYWVVGVPSGYLLAFHFGMGATGIWTGLIIGLSLVSISLTFRFLKRTRFPESL